MSPSSTAAPPRALLIVNPAARRAAADCRRAMVAFAAAGVTCDVMETAAPGDAGRIAQKHGAGYSKVFALGGDGTAADVIGALADGGPPVGVLPGGTGNVLAKALKVPMQLSAAVPALLRGSVTQLDLGRTSDGRHFIIGLGVGVDEAMIANASSDMKRRLGFLAYFWSGTVASLQIRRIAYRLTVDGVAREGEAVSVLVANLGEILGGLINLGHRVRPNDGLLDVIAFEPASLTDALRIGWRMFTGSVARDPCVVYTTGKRITLETLPPRRGQADGELLGNTPFDITVVPGAARLLTPAG